MPNETNEFTIEQFNVSINAIVRAQARATKEIGSAILMALYFANAKSDAGAANALVNCLRKSTKQAGIIALLETHGNLAHLKNNKKETFAFFDAKKDWSVETVKELRTICAGWESFRPEKEEQELDLMVSVERLLKKAEQAKKNHKDVKHGDLAEKLNALLSQYSSEQIVAVQAEKGAN